MTKNSVICGIEYALRDDGCNEIAVSELFARVKRTRGNFDLSLHQFVTILKELEKDGLFESIGAEPNLAENSLVTRSQMHPSVPYGGAIEL